MLNNFTGMGRLTADPELRTVPSGSSVINFTIAIDRPQTEKVTDFIRCVAWRQTADFIHRNFRKGDMIAIFGSVQTHSYEDRNGNKVTSTEICAERASFCGGRKETAENTKPPISTDFESVADDDGLPF